MRARSRGTHVAAIRELLASRFTVRLGFAALSGALVALGFPDFDLFLLPFIALVPLLLAVVSARGNTEAFLLGLAFSSVTWLINVPWVITVMSRYGGLPYPVGVAIYAMMALYLGIFGGMFSLLVYRFRLGSSPGAWLLVPAAWAASEYARTWMFLGFPWNLLATVLVDVWPLAQIGRWLGPYGIGFLIVIPSAAITWMLVASPSRKRCAGVAGLIVAVMMLWLLDGIGRSFSLESRVREPRFTASMLQPNISQQMRWDESSLITIYQRMLRMTRDAIDSGAAVIVWPESTVPLLFASEKNPFYRSHIEGISSGAGVDIVLGSVAEDARDPSRVWNAAYLVSRGKTAGRYDKIRLVPFGEYVPLEKMLFFAEKLTHAVGDFQFGTRTEPLVGRFSYGPAICYEVVFPSIARTQVRNGANVLLTITNDAWFGASSAPRQHLNGARLRAIETDRYLLRAATTGISALVDPTGRVVAMLPIDREGIVTGAFSPRQSITPYVRFGDWLAILCCIVTAIAVVVRARMSNE